MIKKLIIFILILMTVSCLSGDCFYNSSKSRWEGECARPGRGAKYPYHR